MSIVNTLALESNRQIKINFDGGDLSSDAGLLLIKEFISKLGIDTLLEKAFKTNDSALFRYHSDPKNLLQMIYMIIAGYFEDDASDELTNDPVFKSVLEKDALASQPTVSRFFNRMDEDTLNQFLAIARVLRRKIYSIQMPQAVILDLDSTLLYELALADNTEDELSHLKNQLYKITLFLKEESDHAKEKKTALAESVADISHQLKTPLTSASILLDNLNENEQMPPETRRRFLREVSRQIYSMNWMIVAMLKLSRLDAGMVALKKEPFSVNRMLTEAIDHLEIFAELKGVKIRVCGMEAQVLRVGDLDWNREAVQNILKNAIEHSKKGETVTVTLSDNAVYTSVSIANPGAPITKEKIKKIFERYYSAANDGSSNIGIGLPLAKAILEKQNAYLSVESENGYNVFIIKYLK